ncbi:hypothetical protein ABZX77_40810 [Streptomyces sp. NPDC004237]|uniref:hypothetical protein n=1 Tax=Streptomyces sp. NPDC004237 TaxID=3154455 RepID=UPI0033BD8185
MSDPQAEVEGIEDLVDEVDQELTGITTAGERRLAAKHWLLASLGEHDRDQARMFWDAGDVALIRLGVRMAAVRIPAHLIIPLVGTRDLRSRDDFLAQALKGGPVVYDPGVQNYYALVPAILAGHTPVPAACRKEGVEILGRDAYLGVPDVTVDRLAGTAPGGYWAVPMDGPGELCDLAAVLQLAEQGVPRAAVEEATP